MTPMAATAVTITAQTLDFADADSDDEDINIDIAHDTCQRLRQPQLTRERLCGHCLGCQHPPGARCRRIYRGRRKPVGSR